MMLRGSARTEANGAWHALGLAAMLGLWWACRGAPLGTAVTDDYTFLATLQFQRPLDWLGPMDAPFYWRPIGRQLYFSLVGPWLLGHPWMAAGLHAALLAGLYVVVERIARRGFAPPVAAMIAAFPLSAEPARVLLGWPSGGQHLLAMLGAALAIHEALAGRRVTATIAALAALLSHESAALVLPAFPLIAWFRGRRVRPVLPWTGIALAVALAIWLGHEAARARGMGLPSDGHGHFPWARIGEVFGLALRAALNLEDLAPARAGVFAAGYLLLGAVACVLLLRGARRSRLAVAAPALLGAAAWFVAGLAPLAYILPDWNGWRASLPTLGLGVATVGMLGIASPWLAGGFLTLRLVALLLATPAPAVVTTFPPETASDASFVRLVRIQRTVESTRLALTRRHPRLPSGATVRYWLIPSLTLVGFEGPSALRVWYGDATLHWGPFAGAAGLREPPDALVEYSAFRATPATVIEPAALDLFARALDAMAAGDVDTADRLLAACFEAQPAVSEPLYASLAHHRARMAIALGHPERADSLNRLDFEWAGESGRYHAVRARIAAALGDFAGADQALRRCLTLVPRNPDAIALARDLGLIPPGP